MTILLLFYFHGSNLGQARKAANWMILIVRRVRYWSKTGPLEFRDYVWGSQFVADTSSFMPDRCPMVDSSRAWCQQHIVNLGLRVDQSARHIDWYTDFKKKKWFLFRGGYRSSEQNAILLNISMPIDKQKLISSNSSCIDQTGPLWTQLEAPKAFLPSTVSLWHKGGFMASEGWP